VRARWLALIVAVGALALAIAALVGGGAGGAGTSGNAGDAGGTRDSGALMQRFFDRFAAEGDSSALANLTVANGTYLVTGRFDIRSLGAPVTLDCGLADANGGIGYLETERESVMLTTEWQRVELGSVFDLPDTTIALECRSLGAGLLQYTVRDVSLAAFPELGSTRG
jgi:hypothetical protein